MSADHNLNTIDSAADIIDARRAECVDCKKPGVRVDESNGLIVIGGITTLAPRSERWLMHDPIGDLLCEDCAEESARFFGDGASHFDIGGDDR